MAVDPNIKKKADDIRNKVYGKEVRESLASGLEAMSTDVVENTGRQDNVESQFQDVIDNTTGKDVISAPEIIAARNGEANLKTRIDKDYQEVTAQLAQSQSDIDSRGVNVSQYAHEVVDNDWTVAIQKTLDTHGHAIVSGDLQANSTIEVKQGQILEVMNDSSIFKPETADNTLPVVWLKANYAVLKGHNKHGSFIRSHKESPLGVVCFGYLGMNDTEAKNILYGSIHDIGLSGHREGGNETGIPSVVLAMYNPSVNWLVSYFHSISRLYIENGNIGLLLEGGANANIANDIQFIYCGNEKWLGGGAIVIKDSDKEEPVDNTISNVFHHRSTNADTLVFEGSAIYNMFTNIVSEQGGSQARWLVEKEGDIERPAKGNTITGIGNVSGGNNLSENFLKTNTIISNGTLVNANRVSTNRLNTNSTVVGEGHYRTYTDSLSLTDLTEDTAYKAVEIKNLYDSFYTFTIEITVNTRSPLGLVGGSSKAILEGKLDGVGNITVKVLESIGSSDLIINPIINGKEMTLGIKLGDNGTATANTRAYIDYKISAPTSFEIVKATENTVITDATTIPINS